MKYTRIYDGDDGETHFEDVDVEMAPVDFAPPAPPMDRSALIPSSGLHFLGVPAGWYGEPHPAPRRQFVLILEGEAEATASDGTRRRCHPGSVVLLDDTAGKGHGLRALGDSPLRMAVVPLIEETEPERREHYRRAYARMPETEGERAMTELSLEGNIDRTVGGASRDA